MAHTTSLRAGSVTSQNAGSKTLHGTNIFGAVEAKTIFHYIGFDAF